MSLERGGRTDKEGNAYENRFLARLFLKLIDEKLCYVQVEPVEENSDYAEFITVDHEGRRKYYQCKASNRDLDHWRLSDLISYKIFSNAQQIVDANPNNQYVFISPLGYDGLDSMCDRARTCSSPEDFVAYQLTQKYSKYFSRIARELQLDTDSPQDRAKLVWLLSRCYFETYGRSRAEREDLEDRIGYMFFEPSQTVRVLLEHYANDNRRYGVKITAAELLAYLAGQGVQLRDMRRDERVLPHIQTLNSVRWGGFSPINDVLFHRSATEQIIHEFESGSSLVVHGRAGAGKSGCVEEFIQYLKQQKILYLAIKLDKEIPKKSADDYGKDLGLPQSPVYCLDTLAQGNPCVLILDQLDSLRWTSAHSATALDVCKEMIRQTAQINKEHGGKISILLASRTFDLETDPGLQSLIENPQPQDGIKWSKVQVGPLSEKEVQSIVGASYTQMPLKLKKTLQIPASLFVWSQLEEDEKRNVVTSSFQLMEAWWEQIKNHCRQISLNDRDVCACKDKIVSRMDRLGQLALPETIFVDDKNCIDALVSNGLLSIQYKNVCFVHQSFLDYFLAQKAIQNIYDGQDLADQYQAVKRQKPSLRYRFLMILQTLMDSDTTMFVTQAHKILESDVIHFYFKCAVFEIVSQWEGTIDSSILSLVKQYQKNPQWARFLFRVVYQGHPNFVEHYFDGRESDWLGADGMQLLRSISDIAPDFVLVCVKPYAFHSQETDKKILATFNWDAANDSDAMFALRLEIAKKYQQEFRQATTLWYPARLPVKRLLSLLHIILDTEDLWEKENLYLCEAKECPDIIQTNYITIVKSLFPHICAVTKRLENPGPYHHTVWANRPWEKHEYSHAGVRDIVEFTKMALKEYVQQNPHEAWNFVVHIGDSDSVVGHELVMYTASLLPDNFGTQVLQWLLEDFQRRIFVYTFDEKDYLCYTKKIISKFSKTCDSETLQQLEQTICEWNDDPAFARFTFQRRIKINREEPYAPVYDAYWGHMQKELLPAIGENRLSPKGRELLAVVQRNHWIYVPFYHAGSWSGGGGAVVSPVAGKEVLLSEKKWLQIVSTPTNKMKSFQEKRTKAGAFVEASPPLFASSLEVCVKKQPVRFAKLALSFPEDCFPGYISSVLYGLANGAKPELPFDVGTACELMRKFYRNPNNGIGLSILHLIRQTVEADWPEDVLSIVIWLALYHPDPQGSSYNVHSQKDPPNQTLDTIKTSAMNCVRGQALFTLAALVANRSTWLNKVQHTVIEASDDVNDSVRFAIPPLTSLFYPDDPDFCRSVIKKLIEKDFRIIGSQGFWYLLRQEFLAEPVYYRGLLIKGCQSEVDDIAECAAGQLSATILLFNDTILMEWLQTHPLSHRQLEEVCKEAVNLFPKEEYRERSETIIRYCAQTDAEHLSALHHLFFEKRIDLQQDKEFVLFLLASKQGGGLAHLFFRYLNDSQLRGREYAAYLRALSSVPKDSSEWYYLDASGFANSALRLLDDDQGDSEVIKMALDIWDELYKNNLANIQELSTMLNNLE